MAVKKKATAKKKAAKTRPAKAAVKSVIKKSPAKKTTKVRPAKTITPALLKPSKHTVYVDSCLFFPPQSGSGYIENFQEGRNTITPGHSLMAAIPLPVNAVIQTITIYYKNNTKEDMQVIILKKHIDHHAFSGEVEVSLDFLPPATSVPDNFVEKEINHFDAGGLIKDKYLYYIEITNTIKNGANEVRTVRGMRIEYTY